MSRTSSVNKLYTEIYKCTNCDKEFIFNDIKKKWKCPECDDYICVYVEDKESNTRIVLIRKKACDLEKGDFIHLPGGLADSPYQVLGVNILGKKLGIGLKGYGQFKVFPGDTINCRMGAW